MRPLFLVGEPALLELHRTDIGQRRMQSAMIVEAHTVGSKRSLELVTAVLAPLVGMEDQSDSRWRLNQAILRASIASSFYIPGCIDQPTNGQSPSCAVGKE